VDDIYEDVEKTVILLRAILLDMPKTYEANKQEIELCEKEIIDIEHVIELTHFSAAKGFNLAKEIQRVRLIRRRLKDQNEFLAPLVELASRMKTFQNDVNKVLGEVRKIKQWHENRFYKMRVREDLQAEVGER
jgi:hypothetical protein